MNGTTASRSLSVTWQIECAVVSWCSWLNRRVSPSALPRNWILWASWTRFGSMRACQRQSGMESTRFLYLYKVAPSRRLSTQKADTTEATNALGEIVFVKPNEHGKHFFSYVMARNEGWNPMFLLNQMSSKHFLSCAMARKRSQHEGWNLWSKCDFAASWTIRWMTSTND